MRRLFGPWLLAVGITLHAATIQVSPTGPVTTLQEALELVARQRVTDASGPWIIEVAPARYELAETIRIRPEHTGDGPTAGLTIRSAGPTKPVLSGGRRVTGWQPSTTRPGVWTTVLPEARTGAWVFTQLYLDGRRLQRARTPNAGSHFQTAGPLGTASPIEIPFRAGDVKAAWAGQPGAELVMLMKWTDLHVPLRAVDSTRNVLTVPGGPRPYWMDEPDARFWIENVADALDAPGEWFLDRTTGELSVIPPAGVNLNTATVVAPRLAEIVRVEGNPAGRAVRGLRLENLVFADTDYPLPKDGLISPQAAVPVPGSFRATHAAGGVVTGCAFETLGGYALELGRGAQNWHIVGNTARDIGAGGVRLGEPGDRETSAFNACHSHQITDNRLEELGRVFAPACGIIVFQSGTNRIAHNHLRDLYYTGISVGWNWGYRETPCRANVIEFNLVEQVGQGRLSDMGGIYTLGPQPGTVIRNNVFRDVRSYRYGGWGLYTDEGSTGILLENNVAYRCQDAGFHQHYGRDNVIRNNLLAWNRNHSVMRTRVEEHRSFWFTNNVVVTDSGTLLGSNWGGTTNQFWSDGNVWFDTRAGTNAADYTFAGKSWHDWQARGFDPRSVIADPLLVDPARPELGLRAESPAFRLGFRPIDLSRVGPRPPQDRR